MAQGDQLSLDDLPDKARKAILNEIWKQVGPNLSEGIDTIVQENYGGDFDAFLQDVRSGSVNLGEHEFDVVNRSVKYYDGISINLTTRSMRIPIARIGITHRYDLDGLVTFGLAVEQNQLIANTTFSGSIRMSIGPGYLGPTPIEVFKREATFEHPFEF